METFIQGFSIGFGLTIMVGPITLTILDASLSDGWKAGLITALAMWVSDLGFIAGIYYGGNELVDQVTVSSLSMWVSFAAAFILTTIGVTLYVLRNKEIDLTKTAPTAGHVAGHLVRGFLVNTFSPFTLIFWPTLIAGMVFGGEMTSGQSVTFFIAIMLAIMSGDIAKAFFANWIRQRISPMYMRNTRIGIAAMFCLGGVYMAYKGFAVM